MGWDAGTVVALNHFVIGHHLEWLVRLLGVQLTYLFPLAILFEWFRRDPLRRRAAFAAALALVVGAGLYLTTNHLFARPRPDLGVPNGQVTALINRLGSIDESSFPSGHATAAFAVTVGLGFIDAAWFWALLPFALLNTAARVAAGVHYPTDILAGASLGTLTATFIVLNARWFDPVVRFLSRISDRLLPFLPHPPAPPPVPPVAPTTKNPG